MSNTIGRVWEIILYPDRLRSDWRSVLESYGLTGALSPLHNMDIWSEEDKEVIEGKYGAGELKEPHYHLVLVYGGNKSFKQIFEFSKELSNIPDKPFRVQRKDNVGGAIRYLDHSNSPLKYKYDHDLIESIGGFDFEFYFKPTLEQEDELCRKVINFILENKIVEYGSLVKMIYNPLPFDDNYGDYIDMFRYVRKHTIFLSKVIDSLRYSDDKCSDPTVAM